MTLATVSWSPRAAKRRSSSRPSTGCLQLRGAPPTADQIHSCDIHGTSVDLAKSAVAERGGSATLVKSDFFEYTAGGQRFDAVVGNPSVCSLSGRRWVNRRKGFEAALAQGVRLPGLASSWAAFTIHAASFLKPEGGSRWSSRPSCCP